MWIKKPTWVILDLGGVLLDWKAGLHNVGALLEVEDQEVLSFIRQHLVELENGDLNEEDFWAEAAKKYSYKNPSHTLALAWIETQPLIVETWKLVEEISRTKYKMAIMTNNWLGVVENQLKDLPLFGNFEFIVDSSQERVSKPNERMYRIVEERAGVLGSDLFLIDDSPANVLEAERLGWYGFTFDATLNNGKDHCDEIRKLLDI